MNRRDFPSTPVTGAAQSSLAATNKDYRPKRAVMTLLLLLCMVMPALAQSNDGIVYWPAVKLKGYSSTLKATQNTKKSTTASEILSDLGNYKFEILRRDASGTGELHQNWTDVFIVQGGEATIAYGGKIEESRDTGNGEFRGPKMVGGKSQKVALGDVLVMPPGVPHQTLVEPGKSFFALIVKVQKK
jgi:uncharacterized RmlC-like cupin family protein